MNYRLRIGLGQDSFWHTIGCEIANCQYESHILKKEGLTPLGNFGAIPLPLGKDLICMQ